MSGPALRTATVTDADDPRFPSRQQRRRPTVRVFQSLLLAVVVFAVVVFAVVVFAGAIAGVHAPMLEWLERRLIYFPSFDRANAIDSLAPDLQDVWFGEEPRLHGLFLAGSSTRTAIVFHGNGGNVTHRVPLIRRLNHELGANVLAFDYQGYGQSPGQPSERSTRADARAALAFIRSRPDLDPTRVVYFGESLGGAVAVDLAVSDPPAALVLQSTFTSLADLTRLHYPVLAPLLPLVRNRYDTLAQIPHVRAPVTVIHGDADALVPVSHAHRLYAAASSPKRLLIVPGAGHNDVLARGGPSLWAALREPLIR